MAGHDINYIAVSGALGVLGRKGTKPFGPINILGDFAGGGAVLFQGITLALLARERTGEGQVVEANMVDGSAYLMTFPRLAYKTPALNMPRGENLLDSGCPYYDTYETKDGKYMAVGALEPQFFALLIKGLGLQGKGLEETRYDRDTWPAMLELFTKLFKEKTRAEWERIYDGTDACVTPVLELGELENDPKREGDVRPIVTLSETPALAIKRDDPKSRSVATGQGEGVQGDGWTSTHLRPSENGEKVIQEWLGWGRGKQYDVLNGGLVLKDNAKL
jgi:alpha-methylacyl-CoA racemase